MCYVFVLSHLQNTCINTTHEQTHTRTHTGEARAARKEVMAEEGASVLRVHVWYSMNTTHEWYSMNTTHGYSIILFMCGIHHARAFFCHDQKKARYSYSMNTTHGQNACMYSVHRWNYHMQFYLENTHYDKKDISQEHANLSLSVGLIIAHKSNFKNFRIRHHWTHKPKKKGGGKMSHTCVAHNRTQVQL